LCAEACRAIDVLHEHDIIHRDVTPGNLLISRGPNGRTRVLVADLGVAKSMIDAVGATMTAGTPAYMAPEQASGELQLDRRADIYSLTAVTYAMLSGSPPFPVKSIGDILARPVDLAPAPLSDRIGAPNSLDAVMLSGLASDRNRRPPTALLLADAFDTLASQMQAAAATADPEATQPGTTEPRTPAPDRRPEVPRGAPTPTPRSPVTVEPQSAQPTTQPTTQPSTQPSPVSVPPPYEVSRSVAQPITQPAAHPANGQPRRPVSSYVLLALAALALFALSMFVTIVALN
jgi:serine/threonine protein kinase